MSSVVGLDSAPVPCDGQGRGERGGKRTGKQLWAILRMSVKAASSFKRYKSAAMTEGVDFGVVVYVTCMFF